MARRFLPPWQQPATEAGPIVLGHRRLYILPTRLGLVYAALVMGLLLAAANYGIALGYLFTFLMLGIGVAGLLHTQRNLLGLVLRPLAVAPVFAGETARLRLAVEPGRRPRAGLRLQHAEADSRPVDLAADTAGQLELALAQPVRGLHRPGRLSLASTWPLGLFRCWTVFAPDWAVLVYPRPAVGALPLPPPADAGRTTSWRRDGDDEFAGLREYRPGDSPRRVTWKSVARGRPPLTKQFTGSGGGHLLLRWGDCPEAGDEARLSRLTRWALDAERAGLSWGLELPGLALPPGRGTRHLERALAALARHGQA